MSDNTTQHVIKAIISSDDDVMVEEFDALPYFEAAPATDILRLAKVGFAGDYSAVHDVVTYMTNVIGDASVVSVRAYVDSKPGVDYDCTIDPRDVLTWLKTARPVLHLYVVAILAAASVKRFVDRSPELRTWFNDLPDDVKTSNDMLFVPSGDPAVTEDTVMIRGRYLIRMTPDERFYVSGNGTDVPVGVYINTCDEALAQAIKWRGGDLIFKQSDVDAETDPLWYCLKQIFVDHHVTPDQLNARYHTYMSDVYGIPRTSALVSDHTAVLLEKLITPGSLDLTIFGRTMKIVLNKKITAIDVTLADIDAPAVKTDLAGKPYLKFKDVKPGMVVHLDGDFGCVPEGDHVVHAKPDDGELYVLCTHGRHILAGQNDGDGFLVGVTAVTSASVPQPSITDSEFDGWTRAVAEKATALGLLDWVADYRSKNWRDDDVTKVG